MNLTKTAVALFDRYTNDTTTTGRFWQEIADEYSGRKRHYHNLHHLQHMLNALEGSLTVCDDADTSLFAILYHDIIYSATAGDNEEKSAEVAGERLLDIGYDTARIARCKAHIITTKGHETSADADTNLLLDADLSILGASPEDYKVYCANVRKEYSVYPDFLYRPGRKKVITHFLGMDRIYKTELFRECYEQTARINLAAELATM